MKTKTETKTKKSAPKRKKTVRTVRGFTMKDVLRELTAIERASRAEGKTGNAINALRAITDIYARCAGEVNEASRGMTDEERAARIREIFGIQ